MTRINVVGMITQWHAKMDELTIRHNGGIVPQGASDLLPMGKRVVVTIDLSEEEVAAMTEALKIGLMPELWLSLSGRFA